MKKVLMAFSGSNFSNGAFEFARQLNEISPILLSGFFLPGIPDPQYELHPAGVSEDKGETILANNVRSFTALCEKNKIEYRVHIGSYELCMPQLIKETRFSDLFIASSEIFYRSADSESSQHYMDKTLQHAECPVIIVPEEFYFPKNIILAYDGSPASVYAIKQFAYLFPELCKESTLLVYVTAKKQDTLPEQFLIEEFVSVHFNNARYLQLRSLANQFDDWLVNKKKSIFIAGSHSRSVLSGIMNKSFTTDVIEARAAPVFVAHV